MSGCADGPRDTPHLLACEILATVYGERALVNCGGWLVSQRPSLSITATCDHPEHRLGTHGRLKRHQRVCLTCGSLVLVRR